MGRLAGDPRDPLPRRGPCPARGGMTHPSLLLGRLPLRSRARCIRRAAGLQSAHSGRMLRAAAAVARQSLRVRRESDLQVESRPAPPAHAWGVVGGPVHRSQPSSLSASSLSRSTDSGCAASGETVAAHRPSVLPDTRVSSPDTGQAPQPCRDGYEFVRNSCLTGVPGSFLVSNTSRSGRG